MADKEEKSKANPEEEKPEKPVEEPQKTDETPKEAEETKEEKKPDLNLTDLDGLGEKRLAELQAAGIKDVSNLIDADATDLASKTSISIDKVKDWQKIASSKIPELVEEEIKSAGKPIEVEREELLNWVPRTDIGRQVKSGVITNIDDILMLSTPIKEVEIVDKLLPELNEEILNVGRVQRVTDSGRRMRFRVVTAVGNSDGYVGLGEAKGKEAGPTIRKAIERAKLKVISIKRGCGSWECGCGNPHTVPYKVSGKSGGVEVDIRPAPRGVGLVSGDLPKKLLSLAGISDAWVHTRGHTRTSLNFARAIYAALYQSNTIKVKKQDEKALNIISGAQEIKTENA